MKKKTSQRTPGLAPFENGQVWQMGDSSLLIGLVGKTLVHYKHYSPEVKRPSVQLTGKGALEQFLQKNAAVLRANAPPPAPLKPARSGGKASAANKTRRAAKSLSGRSR